MSVRLLGLSVLTAERNQAMVTASNAKFFAEHATNDIARQRWITVMREQVAKARRANRGIVHRLRDLMARGRLPARCG